MSEDFGRTVEDLCVKSLSEDEIIELEKKLQELERRNLRNWNQNESLYHLTPTEAENQPDVGQIITSICLFEATCTGNGTGFLAKIKLQDREYIGFFTAGHCMPADLSQLDTVQLHFANIELPSKDLKTSIKLTKLMTRRHILVCAHKGTKTTIQNFVIETMKSCHPDLDFCVLLFTESVKKASAFLKEKGLSFLKIAEPGACGPSPGSPVTLWGFPSYKKGCDVKCRTLSGIEAKAKTGEIPDIVYVMETDHGASGSLVFNYAQRIQAIHTRGKVWTEDSGLISGGTSFDTIRTELDLPPQVISVSSSINLKHYSETCCLKWFPGSKDLLFTGSSDGTVQMCSLSQPVLSSVPVSETGGVMCMDISDSRLAIGFNDGEAQAMIVNLDREKKTRLEWKWSGSFICVIKFSPSGKRVVTASNTKTCRVWNVREGSISKVLSHKSCLRVFDIVWITDMALATACSDGGVYLWRLNEDVSFRRLSGHTGVVWSLALDSTRHLLASGSKDTTVRVWNLELAVSTLTGHKHCVAEVVWRPRQEGGVKILASWDFSGEVRLWDIGEEVCLHTLQSGISGWTYYQRNNIDFSSDGGLLACRGPEVHIWHVDSGHLKAKIEKKGRMVAWSSTLENRLAVVMGEDWDEVRVFDV